MAGTNLYASVVAVTTAYLGPAADRFVSRQIKNHLNKEPTKLARSDLKTLINWIEAAMFIISKDRDLVADYIAELRELAGQQKKTKTYAKSPSR